MEPVKNNSKVSDKKSCNIIKRSVPTKMYTSLFVFCVVIKSITSECNIVKSSATCSSVSSIREIPIKEIKILKIENNFQELSLPSGVFKNSDDLDQLSITQTRLPKVFPNTFENRNLKQLTLRNDIIEDIMPQAFENLPKLQILDLSFNNLEVIRKGVFINLTISTLKLSNNHVRSIEDNALQNLQKLKKLLLDSNQLRAIFILQILDHPETLEVLCLYNNSLANISNDMLKGLSNLQTLNLSFNHITIIEQHSFQQTPDLQTLLLSNNNIKEIDGSAFPSDGHRHIKKLYLNNNELMFLSSEFFFRLSALKKIALVGNPWQCDCFDIIEKFLRENNIEEACQQEYVNGSLPICVSERPGDRCTYQYNEKLALKYLEYKKTYPLIVIAIDCVL